jgi:hypothetical protein
VLVAAGAAVFVAAGAAVFVAAGALVFVAAGAVVLVAAGAAVLVAAGAAVFVAAGALVPVAAGALVAVAAGPAVAVGETACWSAVCAGVSIDAAYTSPGGGSSVAIGIAEKIVAMNDIQWNTRTVARNARFCQDTTTGASSTSTICAASASVSATPAGEEVSPSLSGAAAARASKTRARAPARAREPGSASTCTESSVAFRGVGKPDAAWQTHQHKPPLRAPSDPAPAPVVFQCTASIGFPSRRHIRRRGVWYRSSGRFRAPSTSLRTVT